MAISRMCGLMSLLQSSFVFSGMSTRNTNPTPEKILLRALRFDLESNYFHPWILHEYPMIVLILKFLNPKANFSHFLTNFDQKWNWIIFKYVLYIYKSKILSVKDEKNKLKNFVIKNILTFVLKFWRLNSIWEKLFISIVSYLLFCLFIKYFNITLNFNQFLIKVNQVPT